MPTRRDRSRIWWDGSRVHSSNSAGFHDREDLESQLRQWLEEVNNERPSRATGEPPEHRRQQELPRLRPLRVTLERLAPRIPIQVGVTAEVSHDGRCYAMPPEAAGMAGTLFLYRDHVHIVAGRYQAQHPRYIAKGTVSRQPEHRAVQLAAVSGKRSRRYLQREHLLENGGGGAAVPDGVGAPCPAHLVPGR